MVYDVITMGETMLRLTPPLHQRLEQAETLQMHIGGSESNVAVGLARLGRSVAWVSRLTRNTIGFKIANFIRAHGVDTQHLVWTDEDRNGLYFVEEGTLPRGSQVTYDRANSAMSQMTAEELPSQVFASARVLHTSGINLAIGAVEATERAIALAKAAGCMVSFDFNFRAKLWSPHDAATGCDWCAQQADILFIPLRDAIQFYAWRDNITPEDAIAELHKRFPEATIVVTNGNQDVLAMDAGAQMYRQGTRPVEMTSRIGAGDAFVAGFLHAFLDGDVQSGLALGTLASAYKLTHPGDVPLWDADTLLALDAANSIER